MITPLITMTEDVWQSLREMPWEIIPEEDLFDRPTIPSAFAGQKHTEESKALMRKPKPPFTKEHRENLSKAFTGRKYSEEYKENMRRVKNNTPYRITYDDGRVELIQGLSAFAREKNYNKINLQYVKSGRQKYHKDIVKVEKLNNTQDQEVR